MALILLSQAMIQSVRAYAFSGQLQGHFRLSMDTRQLSSTGDHVVSSTYSVTDSIAVGAVAMRVDEVMGSKAGNGTGFNESMQAKVEALALLRELNVTVTVTAHDCNGAHGGCAWKVTFFNAPYWLPTMAVAATSLHNGGRNASVSVHALRGASLITGGYRLTSDGVAHTPYIPCNASTGQLTAALEALPGLGRVAVARSPMGLSGEYTWLVTFLTATPSTPLLIADDAGLACPACTMAARPTLAVSRMAEGFGVPPSVIELRSLATRVDPVDVLTLRATTSRGMSGVHGSFGLRLDLGSVGELQGRGWAATTGPIYPGTLAMETADFTGPYPPHAAAAGSKVNQSIEARVEALANLALVGFHTCLWIASMSM